MSGEHAEPSRTEFFHEPFWNMMQLVAWVYSRDQAVVHRASSLNSDFGSYSVELKMPDGERRLTEIPGERVSVSYLILSRLFSEGKDAPDLDVTNAIRAILRALSEGRLHATGIPAGRALPERIEADAWGYLDLFESDRHDICARIADGPQKYEMRYCALKVKRDDVLAVWPNWNDVEVQQRAERRAAGRYQLREAAEVISQQTGERVEDLLEKLMRAASSGALTVYRPGENQRYTPDTVRDFYEEAHESDLDEWLRQHEPRIPWHFAREPEASPEASDSAPLADEGGLSKRERQIRAIESAADQNAIPRMEIPTGGKKTLRAICKQNHRDLFGVGDDPFNEAWQEGVTQKRLRMKDHDRFASR